MTISERIKYLRKSILNLTQDELGEKLGVTKSSISRLEKGINNFTEQMIKSICREFNVNEEWLKSGTGDMFIENSNSLEKCLKENNATAEDIKLIKCYLGLDLEIRKNIHKHFETYFNNI